VRLKVYLSSQCKMKLKKKRFYVPRKVKSVLVQGEGIFCMGLQKMASWIDPKNGLKNRPMKMAPHHAQMDSSQKIQYLEHLKNVSVSQIHKSSHFYLIAQTLILHLISKNQSMDL